MSSISELYNYDTEDKKPGFPGLNPSGTVHVNDLDESTASAIRRTKALMGHLAPPLPHSSDKSLVGRTTLGAPASLSIEELESQNKYLQGLETQLESHKSSVENAPKLITQYSRATFPNLAWESVKAGLAKEKITNDQLNGHISEAQKLQKDIDILLDLSAELTALKDDVNEMPEKVKTILGQLKERGIDLWKTEGNEISKEKISELKSLTSAQVDKLRSNLQIIFTTKIQTLVQSIGAILECVKDIIRNNTKLINAANRLPGH